MSLARSSLLDRAIPLALAVTYFGLLLSTASSIGYARDEGFYFQAAESYGHWLDLLFSAPERAVSRAAVDQYFRVNPEHPALMKLAFAMSNQWLHERWQLIALPGTAHRVPSMVLAAAALYTIVRWASTSMSRGAGVVAGLLWVGLPRVLHHAHLACFDVPVASLGLMTTYAYARAVTSRTLGAALVAGFCYGLMLDTKHNAWLLPPVLAVAWLVAEGRASLKRPFGETLLELRPLLVLLVLGPLVLYAAWPWLWFDTWDRLWFWLSFHLRHEYYNMEFLGRTYYTPPMPRAYPWVMTLGTVPLVTLVLALVGAVVAGWHAVKVWQGGQKAGSSLVPVWSRAVKEPDRSGVAPPQSSVPSAIIIPGTLDARRFTDLIWALSLFMAYAPWLFDTTPIFGGTKHWLAAYPYLCLFAGRGWCWLVAKHASFLPPRLTRSPWARTLMVLGLGAAVVAGPLYMSVTSMPWGLSAYTPIVGGARGAATLGLNRTFWGYTSLAVLEPPAPPDSRAARVFVHDTAIQSYAMHVRDGAIAKNYTPTLNIATSDIALYHHEPHMLRVEYQIWVDYGTAVPTAIGTYQGVPVVWLYTRPRGSERH